MKMKEFHSRHTFSLHGTTHSFHKLSADGRRERFLQIGAGWMCLPGKTCRRSLFLVRVDSDAGVLDANVTAI